MASTEPSPDWQSRHLAQYHAWRRDRQFSLRSLFFFTFAVATLLGSWVGIERMEPVRREAFMFLLVIGYCSFPVFFLFVPRRVYWFLLCICLLGLLLAVRYSHNDGARGPEVAAVLLFAAALWSTIFGVVFVSNERKR
jgi:hypothetical protein